MSRQSAFRRKIIYLVCIGGLLGLLALSSGDLTRRRAECGLSQTQLGQIDPTSETIKLATLGMRGVAANILWEKANQYQMKKDWTNLSATLEQIIRLQPNFIAVWRFQAWNLAYNVSVEFDDFRDRYYWVIRGINFLKEGIAYNQREPRLLWDVGHFISHKIGRSDEHKQFRKLFKEDDDFHGDRPVALRDNWLVGKEWFLKSVELVETTGVPMKGQTPLIFRSSAPMCQMSYAEALEADGVFGEQAKLEWAKAAAEWRKYGDVPFATSFDIPPIQLNDKQKADAEIKQLLGELEPLLAGPRKEVEREKRARLTDAQREALDVPLDQRTADQQKLATAAEAATKITHEEVARRVQGPQRSKVIKLIKQLAEKKETSRVIGIYCSEVNFDYWALLAQVEQDDLTLSARKDIFDGNRAFADGDLGAARDLYDKGLKTWRQVLDKYPDLGAEVTFASDLAAVIDVYREILRLRDEPLPQPFILQDILDRTQKP